MDHSLNSRAMGNTAEEGIPFSGHGGRNRQYLNPGMQGCDACGHSSLSPQVLAPGWHIAGVQAVISE